MPSLITSLLLYSNEKSPIGQLPEALKPSIKAHGFNGVNFSDNYSALALAQGYLATPAIANDHNIFVRYH